MAGMARVVDQWPLIKPLLLVITREIVFVSPVLWELIKWSGL